MFSLEQIIENADAQMCVAEERGESIVSESDMFGFGSQRGRVRSAVSDKASLRLRAICSC